MGVFFPFVRNHSIKGSAQQEPWAFTEEVLDACRTAINRRYILMPYIYTAFREASVDGMPVMRPVFMADPQDLSLRSEDKAFLLGGDLMVIPQWAGQVAEPGNGSWQPFTLENTPDRYQAVMKQRPGSVIPTANLAQSTMDMRTDSLTLFVCLDHTGHASGFLYEDEGDGFNYRNGDYLTTKMEASLVKKRLTVTLSAVEGHREAPDRRLRIAYVKGGKTQYSPWQVGDTATMKIK